jgi:hypothetical protein
LALIFKFSTIDAEQTVYEQHKTVRQLFQQGRRRSWSEYNADAVAEWLACRQEIPIA